MQLITAAPTHHRSAHPTSKPAKLAAFKCHKTIASSSPPGDPHLFLLLPNSKTNQHATGACMSFAGPSDHFEHLELLSAIQHRLPDWSQRPDIRDVEPSPVDTFVQVHHIPGPRSTAHSTRQLPYYATFEVLLSCLFLGNYGRRHNEGAQLTM
jgi:hypothetical protein